MESNDKFEMVAKTFQGLENVLANELVNLGAHNVEPGKRMVSFTGNLETMYKANLCCRTALRILKPFYKFTAQNADELYEKAKDFDWSSILSLDKTFAIDTTSYSAEFSHSRYVTYRVKDAIVDWFKDRYGADKRPGVRLQDADVMINVHISSKEVTLSLDSSGDSLHKRGYRVAQTEAPINEVLAAGIILMSGWDGQTPFVDPMCGSGTFLVEAALIAANINPGIYRKGFAFEHWKDFDSELFDRLYNDESHERQVDCPIVGADISPKAVAIAEQNLKSAGVARYVDLRVMPLSKWTEAPQPAGTLVTNPPYGERISAPDMDALYETIGSKLKHVFTGYNAWIIGYRDEYFRKIGLSASEKTPLYNGALECELRHYVIFDGDKKTFLAGGGRLKDRNADGDAPIQRARNGRDSREGKKTSGFNRGNRDDRDGRKPFGDNRGNSRQFGGKPFGGKPFAAKPFTGKPFEAKEKPTFNPMPKADPENPLALRRNTFALNNIGNKQPSLPPATGPLMRSRGWKKRNDNTPQSDK